MASYRPTLSHEFYEDLLKLPAAVQAKANRTVFRMLENPWAAQFHPEKVRQAEPGVHSSQVDEHYRLIWKHIKPDHILFCLVDRHDPAYRRAARKRFALEDGVVRVADILDVGAQPAASQEGGLFGWARATDAEPGALFIGYRDQELLDMGVPQDALPHLRALDNVNQMVRVERLLPGEVYDQLLGIVLDVIERPVVPDDDLHRSIDRYQGGDELYQFLSSEEFKRALAGDMEEWMLFLAPHQRQLVTRPYAGPARVRGVAGSGKTVVAIHRARHLARHIGGANTVLFLTYGNRLPNVIRHLLRQLAGPNAPELAAVECRTIHSWCSHFLSYHGIRLNAGEKTDFRDAVQHGTAAGRQAFPKMTAMWKRPAGFFADEIRYAIKGRAVDSLDQYLSLERSGRGTALGETERRAIWTVYQAYQSYLRDQDKCDWDDFIVEALRLAEDGALSTPYQAAVVDEIQDLTEATVRLIRAIVTPGENDLFLVGDGLQRLYPGGYTLGRVGIDITGRGTLLRRNYRNTQEILRAAFATMADVHFNDLDDQQSEVVEPEYSLRQGPVPALQGFDTPEQEIVWVGETIEALKEAEGYQDGAFAVLYRMRRPYQGIIQRQYDGRFPLVELTRDPTTYFGPSVKHSTFDSAKGLEFKVVFIVGVTDGRFVPLDDWSLQGPELEDHLARERSRLFVAMTRARDRLYLSYSRGRASRFLANVPGECLTRQ